MKLRPRVSLSVVLHEFGHALGLLHEHQREDASKECIDALKQHIEPWQDPPVGGEIAGPYDPKSIMNYCYINGLSGKPVVPRLSKLDRALLQSLYGSSGRADPLLIRTVLLLGDN